jgi:hypothetical protein
MGDYSKTTWVENVTQVGPTNLNKIEQGVADATKQASMDVGAAFDGSAATTNDKKRVTWRRASDGSYLASVEGGSRVRARRSGVRVQQPRWRAEHTDDRRTRSGAARSSRRTDKGRRVPIGTMSAHDRGLRSAAAAVRSGSKLHRREVLIPPAACTYSMTWATRTTCASSTFSTSPRARRPRRPTSTSSASPGLDRSSSTGTGRAGYSSRARRRRARSPRRRRASALTTSTTTTWAFRYWKDAFGYVHVVGEINDDGTALASLAANAIIWDGFPAWLPADRPQVLHT